MIPELDIESANYEKRIVLLNDGTVLPIITFFDMYGDETDDPNEATAFVCGKDDFWMVVDMDNLELTTIH